jgi:four helix bundle protein
MGNGGGVLGEQRKSIESHRDLIVWQKSMDLAVAAYRVTASFPADERYGLTSQIRRSGASIPANIAEGCGRESAGAYAQQLRVAQGSLKEFETHIELAHRVGIVDTPVLAQMLESAGEIGRMLRGLIRSVER